MPRPGIGMLSFTERDLERAWEDWGCNCGPAALAYALGIKLHEARDYIAGFAEKRYTSPSMMRGALVEAGMIFDAIMCGKETPPEVLFDLDVSLVRVQWTGPWCEPTAPPKWAYRKTHWIATVLDPHPDPAHNVGQVVFDVNSCVTTFDHWRDTVAPWIVENVVKKEDGRAYGGWFPTNLYRVRGLVARSENWSSP